MRLLYLALIATSAWAQTNGQVSFVNEGVINAPIEQVWQVLSTSDGYKVLGPAKVDLDLRIGGLIRTHYSPDGQLGDPNTIQNEILAFEPPYMMAIRIHKPPAMFPFKEAWKTTWTVITLKTVDGGRTHMRCASLGFGLDKESLAMKQFFERGNQYTLEKIQKHFAPTLEKRK